jgi:hypothetical protein
MTLSHSAKPGTDFEKERQVFTEQTRRLANAIINKWFDLKSSSALRRMLLLITLLLLAGFLISLAPYPWKEWRDYLEQIFSYLLTFTHESSFFTEESIITLISIFLELIRLGIRAYFNTYVLWYAPAFFLPIFIAFQAAALYLVDIFELEQIRVARKFLRQVAFTGSKDAIHITQGEVALEDRNSPIYKIGGPGKVTVDLDSVALFEKVNGQPHVIGPTDKEPKGKATLDGFECFRQALDLRDYYIDLREPSGKCSAVTGRSLDGIPVTATDVRLMFSIHRAGQTPTPETPYPFSQEAVEHHIYKSISRVTPDLTSPSQHEFNFENSMLGMVRGELGKFMSQRNLTEYLASIQRPEVKKAEEQEKKVLEEASLVLGPFESVEGTKPPVTVPAFVPRRDITNLFSQFTKKFTDDTRDKGVELHWIGVGTWDIPVELVSEKHLEAWKMSRENIDLDSPEAMDKAKDAAKEHKKLSMIQSVPLTRYHESITHNIQREDVITGLLQDYQSQLVDSFEFQHKNRKRMRPVLAAAFIYLLYEFIWRPSHGPAQRKPAASQREVDLYDQLIIKIGVGIPIVYKIIESLIDLQRELNPDASREELLEIIIREWDKDTK